MDAFDQNGAAWSAAQKVYVAMWAQERLKRARLQIGRSASDRGFGRNLNGLCVHLRVRGGRCNEALTRSPNPRECARETLERDRKEGLG